MTYRVSCDEGIPGHQCGYPMEQHDEVNHPPSEEGQILDENVYNVHLRKQVECHIG